MLRVYQKVAILFRRLKMITMDTGTVLGVIQAIPQFGLKIHSIRIAMNRLRSPTQ